MSDDINQLCPLKCDDVLRFVNLHQIFSVHEQDGNFVLTEGCDDYFSVTLRPHQLRDLGLQLIKLSEGK